MLNVKQVFELSLKLGMAADPRGATAIKKSLERAKRNYADLPAHEKEYFDQTRLTNPYLDSSVLVDDGCKEVKRVLVGIDVGVGEILLASQLSERGKKIDLVIGHHPLGRNLAYLDEAMELQAEVHQRHGIPIHLAEKILEERTREVSRGLHSLNHYQAVNIAQLLQVNLMNTHTTTDNLVDGFIHNFLKAEQPETVGELIKALLKIPEYQEAKRLGTGPKIFAGSPQHRIGKFLLEMTGGTNPSSKVYEQFSRAGISTVIGMHIREQSMETVNTHHLNVIVAGHISSDSLGMNLFLDELEKKGIEIVPCGGLIRVSRVKKK